MLKLLAILENYRQKLEAGIYTPGGVGHSVRICQAHVAEHAGYKSRVDWIDDLKKAGHLDQNGKIKEVKP
jgi:hypothetical protein